MIEKQITEMINNGFFVSKQMDFTGFLSFTCAVYLPTFSIKIGQMWVNIPHMYDMGYKIRLSVDHHFRPSTQRIQGANCCLEFVDPWRISKKNKQLQFLCGARKMDWCIYIYYWYQHSVNVTNCYKDPQDIKSKLKERFICGVHVGV